MTRPAKVSPERILAAAAAEFAARGYAGARVDRIARRARINKAMLYYHFRSKKALYRALLRQTFAAAALRVQAVVAPEGAFDEQLERLIEAMHGFMAERPHFPAIMLREVAEGGAHLDRESLAALAAVPRAIGGFIQRGIAAERLRPVDPMAAYFMMFAPLVMFLAGAPIREGLAAGPLARMRALTPERFVHELQHSVRLSLAPSRRSTT